MSWRDESVETRLSETDIEDALKYSSNEVLEFFPNIPENLSNLLKTIVEFANHKGGTVFVGINEDGDYVGVSDRESVKEDIGVNIEDRVEGDLNYYIFEYEIESSDIIEIRVKQFSELPCAVDGKFYQWKPIQTRPLSPSEVKSLMIRDSD